MSRVRLLLAGVLVMALCVLGFAMARADGLVFSQPLYGGELVDAVGFADGSMLVLQRDGERLWLHYYDVAGEELLSEMLKLRAAPDKLIMQVCGGYVQIVAGYADYAERFVVGVDRIPTVCLERVYLPVVVH